jgi:ubiquinone biosynthesis protein Coq4
MDIPIKNKSLYSLHFAHDQLVTAQNDEDLEYMKRKLQEKYEAWHMTLNLTENIYEEGNMETFYL